MKKIHAPVANNKGINTRTAVLPCVRFKIAKSVRGLDKHNVPTLMFPRHGSRSWRPTLKRKITRKNCNATAVFTSNPLHLPSYCYFNPKLPPFCLCTERQVWDPWRVEGGNVMIFSLLYLLPVLFPTLPIFIHHLFTFSLFISSLTNMCLLMRSILTHAQYAYSCAARLLMRSMLTHLQGAYSYTICLLMRSLIVQYIRTVWTLLFFS